MANVLGSFTHPGADGLPIRVLDGDQNTGLFNHPGADGLPLGYLLTESHEVLGATTCALQASGTLTLTAVEPVNLPLVLQTRGQVGPHAATLPLRLQTFGLMTFAFASGALTFSLRQEVPALLTPVAAHAESLPFVLQTRADTGAQGNAALALGLAGAVAPVGAVPLSLDLAGLLTPAGVMIGQALLALALAADLSPATADGAASLALVTAGDLLVATARAETRLALQVAASLQSGVRASTTLALATSGAIPRDATAALAFVLGVAGTLEPANHDVTGAAALVLATFGGATLGSNPEFARVAELLTLHPGVAGMMPGGTSYE